MGEVMPFVVLVLAILVVTVAAIMKMGLNKRAVVRPLSEEDMVQRIKIRLDVTEAKLLSEELAAASEEAAKSKKTVTVDRYETATGRLMQVNVG